MRAREFYLNSAQNNFPCSPTNARQRRDAHLPNLLAAAKFIMASFFADVEHAFKTCTARMLSMGAPPSYYAKFDTAFKAKDVEAVAALYHEDCEWVWHSSGKTMSKEAFVGMMPNFMKMPPSQKGRCVYENSEVCVSHSFNKFPDASTEGTMMVQMLRDGKCYRVETGSTLIPKESPNYIE